MISTLAFNRERRVWFRLSVGHFFTTYRPTVGPPKRNGFETLSTSLTPLLDTGVSSAGAVKDSLTTVFCHITIILYNAAKIMWTRQSLRILTLFLFLLSYPRLMILLSFSYSFSCSYLWCSAHLVQISFFTVNQI